MENKNVNKLEKFETRRRVFSTSVESKFPNFHFFKIFILNYEFLNITSLKIQKYKEEDNRKLNLFSKF